MRKRNAENPIEKGRVNVKTYGRLEADPWASHCPDFCKTVLLIAC